MQYSRLDYKKTPAKLVVPATFYIFERICQLWPESSRVGMSAICDCENLGWAQFDLEVEKLFSDLMSDRLPIRIGHVRVVFVFFRLNFRTTFSNNNLFFLKKIDGYGQSSFHSQNDAFFDATFHVQKDEGSFDQCWNRLCFIDK